MFTRLILTVLLLVLSFSAEAKKPMIEGPILEFQKTNTLIEFDGDFKDCGPTRFRVQDGAMAVLQARNGDIVRFTVKVESDGDVKLYPVKVGKIKHKGELVEAVSHGDGISIINSVAISELKNAGIDRIQFKAMGAITPTSAEGALSSSAARVNGFEQPTLRCCGYTNCYGQPVVFCTTGIRGCASDWRCTGAGCCVEGGRGGGDGFPQIP